MPNDGSCHHKLGMHRVNLQKAIKNGKIPAPKLSKVGGAKETLDDSVTLRMSPAGNESDKEEITFKVQDTRQDKTTGAPSTE